MKASLKDQFTDKYVIKRSKNSHTYVSENNITGALVQIEKINYPKSNCLPSFVSSQLVNRKMFANVSTMQRTLTSFKGDDYMWFVQEHVEGPNLLEFSNGGPLPLSQTKYLFFLFAETIVHLHNGLA